MDDLRAVAFAEKARAARLETLLRRVMSAQHDDPRLKLPLELRNDIYRELAGANR